MYKRLALALTICMAITLIIAGLAVTSGPTTSAAPPMRPTPTPGIAEPDDMAAQALGFGAGLPDLVVTAIQVDQPARQGVSTTIRVIIENQGTADVQFGNNFFVDLYIDPGAPPEAGRPGEPGTISQGVQGFLMKVGLPVPVTFEYVFPRSRSYTLYAQVDTDGDVIEADEDNNVFGPLVVEVRPGTCVADIDHRDFGKGFSNLDLSHPLGLVPLGGVFEEPHETPLGSYTNLPPGPHIYDPDFGVSDYAGTVNQVAPSITRSPTGHLFVVWEDGRHGELSNRRIYFSRSLDGGTSWSGDTRVSPRPLGQSASQRGPRIAYDPLRERLYLVWQDNRAAHYDIYFASSTDGGATWSERTTPLNDDIGTAEQLRPSLSLNPAGDIFVVWQDRRHGNDDIYFTFSEDGGATWGVNTLVTDHPASTAQSQRFPSVVATEDRVYVVWEDARSIGAGDEADIYFTWGTKCPPHETCPPYTFDVDRRVNNDTTRRPQRDPTIATSRPRIEITQSEAFGPDSPSCSPPEEITVVFTATYKGWAVHFAWQDFRKGMNNPDIYYAWTFEPPFYLEFVTSSPAQYGCLPTKPFSPVIFNPFGEEYEIFGNTAANTYPPPTPESCSMPPFGQDGRLPCDPPPVMGASCDRPKTIWQTSGSIQEHAALTSGPPDTDIVYLMWSDRRNYDDWRADIYVARPIREPESPIYEIVENLIVNSNAKLLRYLQGDRYMTHAPAAVRKFRPAGTYADPTSDVPYVPYVTWDDNRRADPLAGYALERNIFFARPGAPPSPGVFVSRIFQARDRTRWSVLEWWGVTPVCTRIFFQTRTGDTPWPDASWSDWTGSTWDAGEGKWVYPAPSEIVDANRQLYPSATYLQYRFWIVDCDGSWKPPWYQQRNPQAWVSKVIVHYEESPPVVLPLIAKNHRHW